MKKAWNLSLTAVAICAAFSIGFDWYNGEPAGGVIRLLAILFCLELALNAIERAFPWLSK